MKNSVKRILSNRKFGNMLIPDHRFVERCAYFVSVHPGQIKNISLLSEMCPVLNSEEAKLGIYGGLWNYFKRPYSNHYLYRTALSILQSDDVSNTSVFEKVKKCKMEEKKTLKTVNKLNRIIDRFKRVGYKSQYELGNMDNMKNLGGINVPFNEIVLGIDKNGNFMRLVGGNHRITVAQNLGLREMTAILTLIHPGAVQHLPAKRRLLTGNIDDFRPFESKKVFTFAE
jgi:hypothetical protein